MEDKKEKISPPANCAHCAGELRIPSLAEYVRCFFCAGVSKVIRHKGTYITMKVDEKKVPAEKIVNIFEEKKIESPAYALHKIALGFLGGVLGMAMESWSQQYQQYQHQKRQERKEREKSKGKSEGENPKEDSASSDQWNDSESPKMLE